jgi:hypothetical protein
LMRASTCSAGVPCWPGGRAVAEAAGADDEDGDDEDGDEAGRGVGRLARTEAGTRAMATWMGLAMQDAAAAGPQGSAVLTALAVPGADGGGAGPGPAARYRPPAISAGTASRPNHRYLIRRTGGRTGSRLLDSCARWRRGLPVGS